jgi:hypothetical protein
VPENARLLKQAAKELLKMDVGHRAALLDAFGRVCRGTQKRDEDEDLPIGKGKKLRAVRTSYQGSSLRLIYARVTDVSDEDDGEILDPDGHSDASMDLVAGGELTVFLGLHAWSKKRNDMPTDVGEKAWDRLQSWLQVNPGFGQC